MDAPNASARDAVRMLWDTGHRTGEPTAVSTAEIVDTARVRRVFQLHVDGGSGPLEVLIAALPRWSPACSSRACTWTSPDAGPAH